MHGLWGAASAAVLALAAATASAQSVGDAGDNGAQIEEIIVTGRTSGVPLWTVRSDQTTLVLVGAIEGVAKTTRWDPESLTEALRRADRVMFPQMQEFTASPFRMIGWVAKWNAMGSLPKGQSLAQFVGPDEMRRLAELSARSMVRRDYERRHPLHLARDLRDRAKGDLEYGRAVTAHVRRVVKQYDLTLVPLARAKAKPVVKDLFSSSPEEHVPCLAAAIAMAEAGPAAVQARSDAWAERRVADALASPADAVHQSCWPAEAVRRDGDLANEMKRLLAEPQVTVAVLTLRSLAERGGILDSLESAGFDVQGPVWK